VLLLSLMLTSATAEPVAVRFTEGLVHGFLVLGDLAGTTLADGDLTQTAAGTRVTSRLVFRFRDGSLHDETAVFSQTHAFRLLSYRLVQRGPSFPRPIQMTIDPARSRVAVRFVDDGREKVEERDAEVPADVANGLLTTILKNLAPGRVRNVTYIVPTPKPRIIQLEISAAGRSRFVTGGVARFATHFVLKPEIGGLAGVLAPLVGRKPPDAHVWILAGDVPAFVRSEQTLYEGGPVWRIELVSPRWSAARTTPR
jgi:hypothetical protein